MFEYHDFHESYFHHSCVIIPERDVLDTDIIGSGCVSRLKRWWHDLFLLCYTSARTSCFYTSSHAMTIDRFRQYRKYRHRIHPMSKFRIFWDTLMVYVFLINKVVFRFSSSFYFDGVPIVFYFLGALLELVIIADFMINLKTGYIDTEAKQVVLDTNRSLKRFCAQKLFFHFASAMPLTWLMFLRYGAEISCGLCKANKFISTLKIISVISLYRVFETTEIHVQNRPWNLRQRYKFIRIALVGFVCMLQFYDLGETITLLVMIEDGRVRQSSRLARLLNKLYHEKKYSLVRLAIYEMNKCVKSLLLFSLGYLKKTYYLDKLVSLTAYLIAHAFFLWCILECYALVSRMLYPSDRMEKITHGAENMMACRQVPDELRRKLEVYFKFKPTHLMLVENENNLYRSLPPVLKMEAKLSCYMSTVRKIPFLSKLPMSILEKIVMMLKKEVFLNNDIVLEAWVPADGLMIVDNGVLAVYSHFHQETGHLIDGDYFGELSLVTDNELCLSYVVAITSCTVLILPKAIFRHCMRQHPKYFLDIKEQMKKRFNNPLQSKRNGPKDRIPDNPDAVEDKDKANEQTTQS